MWRRYRRFDRDDRTNVALFVQKDTRGFDRKQTARSPSADRKWFGKRCALETLGIKAGEFLHGRVLEATHVGRAVDRYPEFVASYTREAVGVFGAADDGRKPKNRTCRWSRMFYGIV